MLSEDEDVKMRKGVKDRAASLNLCPPAGMTVTGIREVALAGAAAGQPGRYSSLPFLTGSSRMRPCPCATADACRNRDIPRKP